MPIETAHPDYSVFSPKWMRCRDACGGQDAVKLKGVGYLPMLPGDDTAQYDAYKQRALYFNASGRTRQAFIGMAFHKQPNVKIALEPLVLDASLDGRSLTGYARSVIEQVVEVGRAGTLVDWSESEERPYFVLYQAEHILNWQVSRIGGKMVLARVVIAERVVKDSEALPADPAATALVAGTDPYQPELELQLRELVLTGGVYRVNIWRKVKSDPAKGSDSKEEWRIKAKAVPLRRGEPMNFIPFVFHSPSGMEPDPQRPPLEDIVDVNLSHYRSSADLEHGRFFVSLPQPWVTGVQGQGTVRMGSGVFLQVEQADAKFGMLEFTGQGLGALEKALADKERMMAVLGSRMLEAPKREVETAEAMQIRAMADGTTLTQIVQAVSESLSEACSFAVLWTLPADSTVEQARQQVKFQISTDFLTKKMSPDELRAVVAAWQGGAMTKSSMVWALHRGEYTDPQRTVEEELALLDTEQPPMLDFKARRPVGVI